MITAVILATGASMNQRIADYVKGKAVVIAVSDAFNLAPWADALVSADAAWWQANPEALQFSGDKFGAMPEHQKIGGVERVTDYPTGLNSGLLACQVAVEYFDAGLVLLCGFDMGGDHYFGKHDKDGLTNTKPERFEEFKRQFERANIPATVINCTPNSALKFYDFEHLEAIL